MAIVKNPSRILSCVPLQWTKLIHDIRGCVATEFTWAAPQKGAERGHALALLSHAPTCLPAPAYVTLHLFSYYPACWSMPDGSVRPPTPRALWLLHSVLFNMTIKNDLQMVVSIPNREQQEAIMLAAVSETSSYCLCVHCLSVPRILRRMPVLQGHALWELSVGLEESVEQSQPPGDSSLFPVRRHLVGLWGCYMDIRVR